MATCCFKREQTETERKGRKKVSSRLDERDRATMRERVRYRKRERRARDTEREREREEEREEAAQSTKLIEKK